MRRAVLLVITLLLPSSILAGQQTPASAPTELQSPLPQPTGGFARHENWAALPLAESGLNTSAYVAVVLGKYEMPTYTREVVRVQWRLSDPIELYIVLPHGVKNPPAILYLYDYRFDSERFHDDGWCTRATQSGLAAVGFTSAFSIERFHNRPLKEWIVSELQEALGESTHDVQMILNYLASRGDIDMVRIGMFGQGSGGAIAVLAAAVDPRILALDLVNPWGDWPDWLRHSAQIPEDERPRYATPEFFAKVSNLDPVAYLPTLGKRHVRIQQVMDDPVTPLEAKEKIAAAVRPPQQLLRFDDTSAHAEHWQKSGLTSWLSEQLQPQAVSRTPN
jgi:hypothetical protein